MEQIVIFFKKYGWLPILKQEGKYALIQFPFGKYVFNILGYETKTISQLTLF